MSTVSNTSSVLDAINGKSTTTKNANDIGRDDFMKLMLTQLKNQDPTNPMQNGEFLAQIAQFNTVTGIQDLQKSFDQFSSSMQSNQALQASSLVGRSVLVQSDTGVLPPSGSLDGLVDLTSSTTNLGLDVFDMSGQLVRHIDMGTHGAGQVRFSWDGRADNGDLLPPGTYKVAATAQIDGQSTAIDTYVAARVDSVTLEQNGVSPTLNLAGLGGLSLSQVHQIM